MRRDRAEAEQDGTPGGVGRALSITVELVTGRGQDWWPRPGRVFAAGSAHTFADLAEAIDVAFGRLDLPDPAGDGGPGGPASPAAVMAYAPLTSRVL